MTDVLFIIEYLGTFVFAITGASIAVKSDFDFFGMLLVILPNYRYSMGIGPTNSLTKILLQKS